MEISLYTLASQITVYGFIVALFIVGFIATLLSSIAFSNGDQHRKLCGALAVFLIALVVNNYSFYLISIFIGGLVVASEDFMLMFVSIIKAEKNDITIIVKTFYDLRKIAKDQVSSPIMDNIRMIASNPPSDVPIDVPTKE